MKHLHELLPTAAAFLKLTVAEASEHVLRVASAKATDDLFSASDIVEAPNKERGQGFSSHEPVYVDDMAQVKRLVVLALEMLVTKGKIVPAYTEGAAGKFRIVTPTRR